jgi:Tol biopolymer transport system component
VILIENAPRVVTREELRDRLWPADTNVDFDTSLNTAVRKIRQALGDSPESPRYIETVPRKGYRFIAPVTYPLPQREPITPDNANPPAGLPEPLVSARQPRKGRYWAIAAAAFVMLAVVTAATVFRPTRIAGTGTVQRFSFDLPPGRAIPGQFGRTVAISANGETIAFVVNAGLNEPAVYYRRISDPVLRAVAGTQGAAGVALSPDGETLLYRRDGHLWTSALDGGKAKRLAPVSGSMPEDAFWNPPDGMIYYTAPGAPTSDSLPCAIWRVPADGSRPPEQVTKPTSARPEWHIPNTLLPGGGQVLLNLSSSPERHVYAWNLLSGTAKHILQGAGGYYLPTGHLLFHRRMRLYAVPFDASTLELSGPEAMVQPDVAAAGWSGGNMAVSENGTLVYVKRTIEVPETTVSWISIESGVEHPVTLPPGPYELRDLSPDGRTALVARYDSAEAEWSLWTMPLHGGEWKQVSTGHPVGVTGAWLPDGKGILFPRVGSGLMKRQLDPPGSEETVIAERAYTLFPAPFSRSQKEILFMEGHHARVGAITRAASAGALPSYWLPRLSPDGRWLAATLRGQVVVTPYPPREESEPFRVAEGTAAVWTPDGRGLIFRNGDRFYRAAFDHGRLSAPKLLFKGKYSQGSKWAANYLMSPDGRSLLVTKEYKGIAPATSIHVVRNWYGEVLRLSPRP